MSAHLPSLFQKIGTPLIRILVRLTPYGSTINQITDDFTSLTTVLDDYLDRRRTERAFTDAADIAAEKLDQFLRAEFPTADPGDINAAIAAVGDVIKDVEANLALLIEDELDPTRLRVHFMEASGQRQRRALYSDNSQLIFDKLLVEVCNYLVEIAVAQPDFTPQAIVSLLHRGQNLSDKLDQILTRLPSPPDKADDATSNAYATQYRRNIARRFDRLDIFGAELEKLTRRYSLNTAYVSLRSHRPSTRHRGVRQNLVSGQAVDSVLATLGKRIILCGNAGCGKTTLLQWAAVSAARNEFPSGLAKWNGLIPFVVRLRKYTHQPLPVPEELSSEAGPALSAIQPEAWCTEILQAGRGLVLIDGLDEISEAQRSTVHDWLEDLMVNFPDNHYVVTSRPVALTNSEALKGFGYAWLLPMEPPEIKALITYWHRAIGEDLDSDDEREDLRALGERLVARVMNSAPLRNLVSNPLLCALTCALNFSRRGILPQRRVKLYEQALDMLLSRRDEARGVSVAEIEPEEKYEILEDLAEWLMINGESEAEKRQVLMRIRRMLRAMPKVRLNEEQVLADFVNRSAILREPVPDTIDFVHRTFQEYLAARALIKGGRSSLLINKSLDSEWQEVIALAAGYAPKEGGRLLKRLVAKADAASDADRNRLYVLSVACLSTAVRVDEATAQRIYSFVAELLPPRSPGAMSSVIAIGTPAVPLLAEELLQGKSITRVEVQYSVESLTRIGGEEALVVLTNLSLDRKVAALDQLAKGWSYFDAERYAREVLGDINLDEARGIEIRDVELVKFARLLPHCLLAHCQLADMPDKPLHVFSGTRLNSLSIDRGPRDDEVSYDFVCSIEHLETLILGGVGTLRFSNPASICPTLKVLRVDSARPFFDCRGISRFPLLEDLSVTGIADEHLSIENSHLLPKSLNRLAISSVAFSFASGWPLLPALQDLHLEGYTEEDLAPIARYSRLESLVVESEELRDISHVVKMPSLATVSVSACERLQDLSPLAGLPALREIELCSCHQYLELASKKLRSVSVTILDSNTDSTFHKSDIDEFAYEGVDVIQVEEEWAPVEEDITGSRMLARAIEEFIYDEGGVRDDEDGRLY